MDAALPGPEPRAPDARRTRRVRIGPIAVDALSFAEALNAVDALVAARRGGTVFTANVDHVVLADRVPEFRATYAGADLALADGMPLVWASRLLSDPLPQKVSGSDLLVPLVERAAARGWRVYFLGAGPGVADEAARRLRVRFPALAVAGVDAPHVQASGPDPEGDAALGRLSAARPDLVLVAFGAPKQELWIHRNRERLSPAVAVGVGASLDFVAGRVRRAPRLLSSAGLEWLWRLGHEPRRLWRRYLVDDRRFAPILWRELLQRRRERRGSE